jgi:acetyltransferase-like isoleucine patch superfamily enzyme
MMRRVIEKLQRLWFEAWYGRRLRRLEPKAFLASPFRLDGAEGITIGASSFVQRGAWLYCCGIEGQPAVLTIGAGCEFGYNNHITAVRSVTIGNTVLTANNVYISDNAHAYENTNIPIMHQRVQFKKAVSIGAGSWIGENACIIGASVGRNCVIGANAVVTSDIPDFSIAVGMPARVIRHFDETRGAWVEGARS